MIMATSTTSTALVTTTSMTMSMPMSMGGACKMSMFLNWYIIDACFFTKSWHITSHCMFAGSCIGVILLVMSLEFLRRVSAEYDSKILHRAQRMKRKLPPNPEDQSPDEETAVGVQGKGKPFRPSILQQCIHALLHTLRFALAYFVMLLAMSYNGYIIISIIIGAFLGVFMFSWGQFGLNSGGDEEESHWCG